jgi:hypothetical protein
MPGTGEMMTIRPAVWQPGIVIVWSLVVGMFVAAAVIWPGQAVTSLMFLALLFLIAWVRVRAVRLEITESAVRARQGWYLPDKQVSRSQIRAIHYYPDVISFRGPERKPIMRTRAEWSLRQMIAVAGELRVPVYDNRRWHNLRTARVGRLVYDPAAPHPVS